MEEQTEKWQLRSGTWLRNLKLDSWRLAATAHGTVVTDKLSTADLGRLIGASRDSASGQWFPADFSYSPQTGAPLQITIPSLDLPWVPPFGAAAHADISRPQAGGLRQTPVRLTLVRSKASLGPQSDPDRTLPELPPGRYRFLVHKIDVASPTLMAVEPEQGQLVVLLPESNAWAALEPVGASLAACPANVRGWRMEVVKDGHGATLYFPTAHGLAAVTPTLVGLSYTLEYFGDGAAIGGPVAWAGEVWLPVLGKNGVVNLVGKPQGSARPIVLATNTPAPRNGFEAPVFDPQQVIWPSEEGQLVLRLVQGTKKTAEWIAWPEGLRPAFELGCPYLSIFGVFWQQCRRDPGRSFEYVQMGKRDPERAPIDAPRLGTGQVSYRKTQRMVGDPWKDPDAAVDEVSSEVVVPLVESEAERAVVGLRINAPQGILGLLESDATQTAVLQLQAGKRTDVLFGTLNVASPWLAAVFVFDAHLWVYHPEHMPVPGWRLID